MSMLEQMLDHDRQQANAEFAARLRRPLEAAPPSIFHLDPDVELTVEESAWLDDAMAQAPHGHEQAIEDCMRAFRRTGAKHHLHQARAVLQHLIDSTP